MKRFALFASILLAAPPARAAAPPPQQVWSKSDAALWASLRSHLPPAETIQKQVFRVLALEMGVRPRPHIPSGELLAWLQRTASGATTRAARLDTLYDHLLLARELARQNTVAARRRSLRAALSALELARALQDEPLSQAVAQGFLLPHLEVADATGSLSRFTLLAPLQRRYALFHGKEADAEAPLRDAALAFWRLQVALAPTPDAAAWPRAHLAMRLLRPENRTASNQEIQQSLRTLEGIVAGEGALIFRRQIPDLRRRLGQKAARPETNFDEITNST